MELSCIYLDLDGTLVDLYGACCRAVGGTGRESYEEEPSEDFEVIWKKTLPRITGRPWTEQDFLDLLRKGNVDFWLGLEKYPWADELLALCNATAPTVIMTSPWVLPESAAGKMFWLHKNIPNLERFALTSVKHHFAHPGALLIDDNVKTCHLFRHHQGQAYIFPQPWSQLDWESRDPLAELRTLLHG